ncbi:FxSxx-COOH cyclophane-containing RiPP peptide [Streptomyces aureus]
MGAGEGVSEAEEPLPDLLELSLADLRSVQHPILKQMLEDLQKRSEQPSEMLWGFNNSF